MTFVKVYPESFIRIDKVSEVRKCPGDHRVTLRTDCGGERWAKKVDWDRAREEAASHIVPAMPGTFHVFYCKRDEDEIDVVREPVIAWLVNTDGIVPMTLFKIFNAPDDDPAIEFPDGTVHTILGIYQSIATWAAEMRDAENHHVVKNPETVH